jgi:hypothetical protein
MIFSYLLEKMQLNISEYKGYDGVHGLAEDHSKTPLW